MADVHHGGGSGSWAGLECWMLRCAHSPLDGLKDVMLYGNVRKKLYWVQYNGKHVNNFHFEKSHTNRKILII